MGYIIVSAIMLVTAVVLLVRYFRKRAQFAAEVQALVLMLSQPSPELLAQINRNGDINDPATMKPLLTLEEFFKGNHDPGSIGYNLPDPPPPESLYALLKKIRNRPDVHNVLIEVLDHESPESWPSSDTVWIITSASQHEVDRWLGKRLSADEYLDGFPTDNSVEPYNVPHGMRAIGVWWD